MAQAQSEIRYLTPPSVDIKKKKYCRFKKNGIKYIDYKDPEFLKKFLNEQGKRIPEKILERTRQNPAPSYHRNFVEISTSYCTSCEKSPSPGAAPLCN